MKYIIASEMSPADVGAFAKEAQKPISILSLSDMPGDAEIITPEQKRVIEVAVKLVKTLQDANDIGEAITQLSEAVDAIGYKGNYKEID